jgi:hypothetical protein
MLLWRMSWLFDWIVDYNSFGGNCACAVSGWCLKACWRPKSWPPDGCIHSTLAHGTGNTMCRLLIFFTLESWISALSLGFIRPGMRLGRSWVVLMIFRTRTVSRLSILLDSTNWLEGHSVGWWQVVHRYPWKNKSSSSPSCEMELYVYKILYSHV